MHFLETSNKTCSPAFATVSPGNPLYLARKSVAAALVILLTPSLAAALDQCAARFRRKDGVVTVAVSSVQGPLRWDSSERNNPQTVAEALCTSPGGTRINCSLSTANQIPPPPPPADCVVRLLDDSSECLAYVKGCIPGERRVIPCLEVSNDGKEVIYQGCNVHIRNALGATATKDATGNLIIGWNETPDARDRSGSHNLVIGEWHSWSATGGIVAGFSNTISAESASVVAGAYNHASGFGAAILGGGSNNARGSDSTVSGGNRGFATGRWSSVAGGDAGTASGVSSFVAGGTGNAATGSFTTVTGGSSNEARGNVAAVCAGTGNLAAGMGATVVGGEYSSAGDVEDGIGATVVGGSMNTALANGTTVVGGFDNEALGYGSTISSGIRNRATGNYSTVNGGSFNTAEGRTSTVGGGAHRTASGESDWVAGSLFEDE